MATILTSAGKLKTHWGSYVGSFILCGGSYIMCGSLPKLGSKFRAEQFRFSDMLTRLQRQPVFQLHEFEVVIDSIRDCVAEVGVAVGVVSRYYCLHAAAMGFAG